jgi:hypothetical protein
LRLLVDECVVRYVVVELRNLGADVVAVSEARPGIDDELVLGLSVEQNRTLITDDYGFGELIYRRRMPAVAVVLIAPGTIERDTRRDSVAVAKRIVHLGDSLLGKFTILEAERTRIRPLVGQ